MLRVRTRPPASSRPRRPAHTRQTPTGVAGAGRGTAPESRCRPPSGLPDRRCRPGTSTSRPSIVRRMVVPPGPARSSLRASGQPPDAEGGNDRWSITPHLALRAPGTSSAKYRRHREQRVQGDLAEAADADVSPRAVEAVDHARECRSRRPWPQPASRAAAGRLLRPIPARHALAARLVAEEAHHVGPGAEASCPRRRPAPRPSRACCRRWPGA